MRRVVCVVVLALVFAFGSTAMAAGKGLRGHERTVNGVLDGVDPGANTITISRLNAKQGELKDKKIKVDSLTKVLLNGQTVALSALTVGQHVTVTVKHGVAVQIQATGK